MPLDQVAGDTNAVAPTTEILLEDGPLLAVNKPAGLLTLGAGPGVPTLEREVKSWLKTRYDKPGNVYLGIPHRLDRPVSGVVVFARNSKTAARLAEQFRERTVRKIYWALVEHPPEPAEGELVDWLLKVPGEARVEVVSPETPGAREARLRYRTLGCFPYPANVAASADERRPRPLSLVEMAARSERPPSSLPTECRQFAWLEIELLTGRMHQIRVQLASRGWGVFGDRQYGAELPLASVDPADPRDAPIALHARSLTLRHPIRYDEVTITAPVPAGWDRFGITSAADRDADK